LGSLFRSLDPEQALAAFDGAVLVVTYDRYFIDRFAEQIWEIRAPNISIRDGSNH